MGLKVGVGVTAGFGALRRRGGLLKHLDDRPDAASPRQGPEAERRRKTIAVEMRVGGAPCGSWKPGRRDRGPVYRRVGGGIHDDIRSCADNRCTDRLGNANIGMAMAESARFHASTTRRELQLAFRLPLTSEYEKSALNHQTGCLRELRKWRESRQPATRFSSSRPTSFAQKFIPHSPEFSRAPTGLALGDVTVDDGSLKILLRKNVRPIYLQLA
jgi:hypothetical protein